MLTTLKGLPESLVGLSAGGTVLAGDIEMVTQDLSPGTRLVIVVEPTFDGYLAELSRGLAKGGCERCALIVPDDMLDEARIHPESDRFRIFPNSRRMTAFDWASA